MMYQGEPQSSRQRMRPWLEARVNSGEIPGLEWIDRNRRIFKVPWKSVSNRDWTELDSQIFKEWAIHTGRFTEGVDQPDWPTWKTRFRTALRKLPYIQELTEQNQLGSALSEPYRVYQFVQKPNSSQEMSNSQTMCDRENQVGRGSLVNVLPTADADEINTAVQNMEIAPCVSNLSDATSIPYLGEQATQLQNNPDIINKKLASCLDRIPTGDPIRCQSSESRPAANKIDTTTGGFDTAVQNMEIAPCVSNISDATSIPYLGEQATQLQNNPDIINKSQIYLSLKYRTQTVLEKLITNTHGCRLFHGEYQQYIHDFQQTDYYENLFGSKYAEPLMLPKCVTTNHQQNQLTQDLLNVTDRGIHFKMENGNIVALRKCRCRVFVSTQSLNNGETTKLVRDQSTVIFDLRNYFFPNLQKYLYGNGPKPSYEVIIGFGQWFRPDKGSISTLLISATLVHTYACHLLTTITCSSPTSPPIEKSKSDDYDKFLDQLKLNSQQNQQ